MMRDLLHALVPQPGRCEQTGEAAAHDRHVDLVVTGVALGADRGVRIDGEPGQLTVDRDVLVVAVVPEALAALLEGTSP